MQGTKSVHAVKRLVPDWPGWQLTAVGLLAPGGLLPRALLGARPSLAVRRSRLPALLGWELLPAGLEGCALKKAFGSKAGFAAEAEPGPCQWSSWPAVSITCFAQHTRPGRSHGKEWSCVKVPVQGVDGG